MKKEKLLVEPMKKTALTIFYFLFLFNIYSDHIIIASDSWNPFNGVAGSSKEGYMVEVAKIVFEKAGHTLEYKNIPWNRTLQMVRNGQIHGAIGPYYEDCPDFIFPENELAMIRMSFFVKKDSKWQYNNISSLKKIALGAVDDYVYGNPEIDYYIEENKDNSSRVQLNYGKYPSKGNIKKLKFNRVDAVIEAEPVFWYIAKEINADDQFKVVGTVGTPKKAYIAFSPVNSKSREYADILSKGIEELRKNGKLTQILKKYGLKDWK